MKCEFCGKCTVFGNQLSHSHRKSNRSWKANLSKKRLLVNGSMKKVAVCTRCLRSRNRIA